MKKTLVTVLMAVLLLALFIFFITGKRNEDSLEKQLQQARLLVQSGDIKIAEDFYNDLINQYRGDPEIIRAMNDLAEVYQAKGQLLKAKDMYQKAITEYPEHSKAQTVQESLWDLNIQILFSGLVDDNSLIYEVQPGDTLHAIAKKFSTTVDLIQQCNNLSDAVIRPQDRLKIVSGRFSILVDKSQNTLTLKLENDVLKVYKVSTGSMESDTPAGEFTIVNKLKNPVHYRSGEIIPAESPDNVLGTRWMGFSVAKYGIHGTIDEATIGQWITEGCVRMRNRDVEELFIIVPIGTKVTIVE